ncbi:MAG: ComEA family DNA-binding protein [Nitrospiria bacterium]
MKNINGLFVAIHAVIRKRTMQKSLVVVLSLVFVFLFQFWAESNRGEWLLPGLNGTAQISFVSSVLAGEKNVPLPGSIDVNTATAEQLMSLPGIGPKLAERIIRDREENGSYKQADDLLRVKGIGTKKLERLRPFLLFSSK